MKGIVLYVDDDEPNLIVFEATFESDFHVLTATSAQEALEIMRQQEIAVLLADQRMPQTTGVELAARVRADFPDVIRLLITAYSDHAAAVAAINQGHVLRYLTKPWDEAELREVLCEALELHQTARRMFHAEKRLIHMERLYALEVIGNRIAHQLRPPVSIVNDHVEQAHALAAQIAAEAAPAIGPIAELGRVLGGALEGTTEVLSHLEEIAAPPRQRQESGQTDVAELVSFAIKSLGSELRARTQLKIDTEPVPPVVGTPAKLSQVVFNLFINAQLRLPAGGPKENLITVRLKRHRDEMVRLEVEDNGRRVGDDAVAQLFDPFFTTADNGASGLGLAVSRAILEELGGSIAVTSTSEKGACFTVDLPAASCKN